MNKGKVDILLGIQWGDEGKGKMIDVLASKYDHVARFQGGPNAGHTLKFGDKKVVLRSIPSGVFQCNGMNIIGNGVVFDPIEFKKEFDELSKHIDANELANKIIISNNCHVITPFHKLQDMANELIKSDNKVGTTMKGIGPCYTDKISRFGTRLGDIIEHPESINFGQSIFNLVATLMPIPIEKIPEDKKITVNNLKSGDDELVKYEVSELIKDFIDALKWLKFMSGIVITNTTNFINKSLSVGGAVLAEGAQGSMLDIDFGTYPYVTSSNTTSGGACTGLGVAPNKIDNIYGVFKAYCTRVGEGPFPTELDNEDGEKIRKIGNEYGAVTGRNRRCGWLDLVQLKYACTINGVTSLAMMKADVLSEFDEIKVCTSYKTKDGEELSGFPNKLDLGNIIPVYTTFKGWGKIDFEKCKSYNDLPKELAGYIAFIENYVGSCINYISFGPDRNQLIVK